MELFNSNLPKLIETIGLLGVFFIIFAETGLFFGFFFPGDSLLFTAGILASKGLFNLPLLIFLCFLGSFLGNQVGYIFGKKVGRRIFNKEDSFWFHKDHLMRAENFYEEHGKKTIILARFVPIIRTFAPIVAGVGKMNFRTFTFYNLLGGFLWTAGLTSGGYFLGNLIPDVDRYLLPIVAGIIVISFLPTAHGLYKNHKK